MRFLDQIETAAAVLGREAPLVQRLAYEGAVGLATLVGHLSHGDDLVDDAGQLVAGLRPVDLRGEEAPIEVIELLVEDSDEPDILRPRVLQVGQPADHLPAMQAVGTAHIGAPGLVGEGFGLALAPLEAETAGDGDGVDEQRVVAVQCAGLLEALADGSEVCRAVGLVIAQRRVGPADEDREVAAFLPGARSDAVAGPALNGQVPGFEVHEQGGGRVQRPEQTGFADAGLAEDAAFHAAAFGEALVGRDDREAHRAPPLSTGTASIAMSAPTAPCSRARL